MTCPFELDVVRWVTGDTRVNELARVEGHLSECATCRAKAESLRRMLSRLGEPTEEVGIKQSAPKVFVARVMETIEKEGRFPPKSRFHPAFFVAAGFVLALGGAVGWTAHRMSEAAHAEQVPALARPAAEPAPNAILWLARDGHVERAGALAIRASDTLILHYANPSAEPRYFLGFVLDAVGNVTWTHPLVEASGEQSIPAPMVIGPRADGDVKEGVASLSGAHGPRRVVALIADRPLDPFDVRQKLQGYRAANPVRELFKDAFVGEWVLWPEEPWDRPAHP